MTPDSIAKEKTKQLLTNLQSKQNIIINEIVLRVGTIKQKIIELADIMAERMDLLDPELPEGIGKEQISSLITQALKAQGCAIAPWINDYLPSKYKNQNKVRIHQTIEKINEICTDLPCKLPEHCSSSELETFYEINEQLKNLLDDGTSHCNKTEEKLEFTAQQRGQQLGGYKFRREISHKDFSEDIPTELIPYVIKNRDHFYNIADSWRTLGDKYFADPPRVLEELTQDDEILTAEELILKGFKDFKMTGDLDHSMERQYVSDWSGKHAAGNSDKFPTMLCGYCSRQNTYDPDDFEIMRFDHTSPSNYRCAKCGGVEVILRGMSREQVGDRAAFLMREAQNLIMAIPKYGITLHRWSKKYIMPKENSRKVAIGQFFSDSSMSGISYKVARKQKT